MNGTLMASKGGKQGAMSVDRSHLYTPSLSRTGFKTYSGWPGLDRREAPVLPAVELTQGPGLRKDSSPDSICTF